MFEQFELRGSSTLNHASNKLPVLVVNASNLFYFSHRVTVINWLTEHEWGLAPWRSQL